ncbi:MAG: YegS/Rv2252/BmrU family lipid kinase [Chloroflexi bacterium]|nr:YegS/Rv2252/BmrU family lipid kinase [Chloroflexota bacterium]
MQDRPQHRERPRGLGNQIREFVEDGIRRRESASDMPTSRYQHIRVIINPASGQNRPILSVLNQAFHAADIAWDVAVTNKSGDAHRFAVDATRSAEVDVVGVYGGDGTVREFASGMVGSDKPLAILPGGTANALALSLGLPLDLQEAASLVNSPHSHLQAIDMGRVGDHYFTVAVGIGIPGMLAETVNREDKDRLGVLAYAFRSIQAMRDSQAARYRITIDNRPPIEQDGVACVIANSGNLGLLNLPLASNISMTDGLLDVILICRADVDAILSLASSMVRQNESGAPFQHWQGREITISTNPSQAAQIDGETLDMGTWRISVVPAALRVILPKARASQRRP